MPPKRETGCTPLQGDSGPPESRRAADMDGEDRRERGGVPGTVWEKLPLIGTIYHRKSHDDNKIRLQGGEKPPGKEGV